MAGGGGRKGDATASAGGRTSRAKANGGGAANRDKDNGGSLPVQPLARPRRSATTEEARLAHMLGDDAGELATVLTAITKNPAALAKAKAAIATAAGQSDINPNGKRNRPQMTSLFQDDSESSDDESEKDGGAAGGTRGAGKESSPELSGSEYNESDAEKDPASDDDSDDDLEEEDVAKELGPDGGTADGGSAEEDPLADLMATIPGKEKPRKKKKKAGNSGAIIPVPRDKGGKPQAKSCRSTAGELVLNAASTGAGFDLNLLLMSHLKMQQAQAEQLARNDRMEKAMHQLLNCFKKSKSGSSQQSSDPATSSVTVTQQAEASEQQLGLLERLKANPKLLSSAKSTTKLLVSDAVNLSLLTSGVADSELMRSNTQLALRVSPDPEQEELFEELYEDLIQPHQMDKFRMKRGQLVSKIRGAGDAYRKAGTDAYGDLRFRTVLAKACNVDVDNQPVPDQLIATIAQLAMVEVVLELHFRGIKRLEKQEAKMLRVREEALAGEARVSAFVLVVAPEDPSVCPMRLQGRVAERAKALAAADRADRDGSGSSEQANETAANPEAVV
ncbi:hypothetical protein KFL_010400010 [Klebsormidium nitens]|uniref:Uncharacterized protein n=1 Tax=Klebsormidium nitens TaxID=105231 RepID=A0A1Y1IUJ6_KLENI|nr:hypothetical protein KFL_010400010 [Klebsormidium nitens]|eukprot:GAQ92526.1 hypothetical protein KFL_010400010 [Klebsormidium nitens]